MKTITTNNRTIVVLEIENKAANISHSKALGNSMLVYEISGQSIIKPIPTSEYRIAGTITKEGVFDFDCSELIEYNVSSINKEVACIIYLETHGIYLNNPMGEKPCKDSYTHDNLGEGWLDEEEFHVDVKKWQEYESNTLKEGNKLLILIQNKP